jgi:hypothetical protein
VQVDLKSDVTVAEQPVIQYHTNVTSEVNVSVPLCYVLISFVMLSDVTVAEYPVIQYRTNISSEVNVSYVMLQWCYNSVTVMLQ